MRDKRKRARVPPSKSRRTSSCFVQKQREREHDAPGPDLAAVRMEPFGGRVRTAALPARSDRDRGQIHRKRNVRIGGSAIDVRPDAEMGIDGTNKAQNG